VAGGNKKWIVCLRWLVFADSRLISYRVRISTSLPTILTHHTHTHTRTHVPHTHTRTTHTHTLRGFLSFPRRMSEISHGNFLSQELCSDLQRITPVLTMHVEEKRNHNKPSIKTTLISVYCLLHVSASV
jgi:hypothetical protein